MGFEPTPPRRMQLECIALDHSAIKPFSPHLVIVSDPNKTDYFSRFETMMLPMRITSRIEDDQQKESKPHLLFEKILVDGVISFNHILVSQRVQEPAEINLSFRRNLDPNHNLGNVASVVPVMEQRDCVNT